MIKHPKMGDHGFQKGAAHSLWKGGRRLNTQGYIMIWCPDHPKAQRNLVREHILVWERVHNQPLPEGWVVHHLNGIKDDNRPENLAGMPSKKHILVLAAKAQRIRELEAKVKILEKAMDDNQFVFQFGEN